MSTNRLLKFRAWIEDIKTMLYGVNVYNDGSIGISTDKLPEEFFKLYHIDWDDYSIRENGTYNHVMNVLTGDEYIWFEDGSFNLMQLTGLHDRNSKEIYEEDIMIGHFSMEAKGLNRGRVYMHEKLYTWFVTWNLSPLFSYDKELIEVVGNIYENPELLDNQSGAPIHSSKIIAEQNTQPVEHISFEQALDEVGALYEDMKSAINGILYPVTYSQRDAAAERAFKINAAMRDYACVALQKLYGIKVGG